MSALDLSDVLARLGIPCEVEMQGRLAVIIPTGPLALDARVRRAIVAEAKVLGFTNVCVELLPGV